MMVNQPVRITNVDFRDGQQSLLGTQIRTEDMLPILEKVDAVGYDCIEMWGGATFDVCIRYLQQDPWERVREFKKRMPRTKLRMLLRGQNVVGYRNYPDDIVEKFVELAANAGIDIFLIFDILNDLRNCESGIRAIKKAGKVFEGNIPYTISPVHNLDQFVRCAQQYETMGAAAVHIEDMAGQLTPDVSFELISALKKTIRVPVHLHCHCTGGMADLAYWEAIRAGVDVIDTNISAFSLGTALPPVESFVVALRDTPRATGLDLQLLEEINQYFLTLREKYREYESRFTGVDIGVLRHQIPGGMLSNLERQLKEMDAYDRISEVLEEAHTVRRDFGYPALGTPMSQIVGVQAALNVIMGERYKVLPKESQNYIRGLYGIPQGEINPELVKQVLESEKMVTCRPADLLEPEYEKRKAEIADLARSEEDIITYALFPEVGRDYLKTKYGI